MQRDTKRRSVSPTTMPRTLPFGFCKATRRPKAIAAAMVGGTRAWARSWVTWPRWAVLVSSSKSNRSVSVVRPDGIGIIFSANCECAGALQNVCIYDSGTH